MARARPPGERVLAHARAVREAPPPLRHILAPGDAGAGEEVHEAARAAAAPPPPGHEAEVNGPCWFFFASGTTNRPKAAVPTFGRMGFVVADHIADLKPGLSERDVPLGVAWLSHGAASLRWRGSRAAPARCCRPARAPVAPARDAALDSLVLTRPGGGGPGRNDLDEGFAQARRWLHHAIFHGFVLGFAATMSGALHHHLLGRKPPHACVALPVQLGIWGGVPLRLGTAGMFWVKAATDPAPVARQLAAGEVACVALLALRIGLVAAFFLPMPCSRMVHGMYGGLAPLRDAVERDQARDDSQRASTRSVKALALPRWFSARHSRAISSVAK